MGHTMAKGLDGGALKVKPVLQGSEGDAQSIHRDPIIIPYGDGRPMQQTGTIILRLTGKERDDAPVTPPSCAIR